ncbi:hypothetical protein M9H77_31046 [Catharanthus roseus]|uniref:Uncharacterized protein n=1 Tax=Catharanthus roseus TaxID=4058 RepID=A0ACB9ZZB6_CATRO|nr:hypothetical protein M9H77_31046 [Catharanthus roseus]
MNFYTNGINSFFASESLCVQNFEDSRIEDKGRSIEKEFGICLEDLPISPCLNTSLYFHENFETKVEIRFEMFKAIVCEFLKVNMRDDSFENLRKEKNFFYHLPFKDVVINPFLDLQDFYTLDCVFIWRTIVNLEWVKKQSLPSTIWSTLSSTVAL